LATLCLAGLLGSTGCAAGLRHPEFKTRHPHLHTIAVLPPKVEVYRLTFQGDQQLMYELLEPIAQQAKEELERALVKRGYRVAPLDLSDSVLSAQPELKHSLHIVRTLLDKELEEYQKRMFGPLRKFTFSVGSEINVFANLADSDALVMLRCTGFKKTGGEIAKDWAKTLLIAAATLGSLVVYSHPSVTAVQLAVIDGNTGDLLWYLDNLQRPTLNISKEKAFRKTVRALMSKFPKAIATTPQGKLKIGDS